MRRGRFANTNTLLPLILLYLYYLLRFRRIHTLRSLTTVCTVRNRGVGSAASIEWSTGSCNTCDHKDGKKWQKDCSLLWCFIQNVGCRHVFGSHQTAILLYNEWFIGGAIWNSICDRLMRAFIFVQWNVVDDRLSFYLVARSSRFQLATGINVQGCKNDENM